MNVVFKNICKRKLLKIVAKKMIIWKIGFAIPFHYFCIWANRRTQNVSSSTDFQDVGNEALNLIHTHVTESVKIILMI